MKISILHIEESQSIAVTLQQTITDIYIEEGHQVTYKLVNDLEDIDEVVLEFRPNLMILDLGFEDMNPKEYMEKFKVLIPETIIIVTSDQTDISNTYDMVKLGASYHLVKDDNMLSDFFVILYSSLDMIILQIKLSRYQKVVFYPNKYQAALIVVKDNLSDIFAHEIREFSTSTLLKDVSAEVTRRLSYLKSTGIQTTFPEGAYYFNTGKEKRQIGLMISYKPSYPSSDPNADKYCIFVLLVPDRFREFFPNEKRVQQLYKKIYHGVISFRCENPIELGTFKQFILDEIKEL